MMDLHYYGDPVLRRHTGPVKRFDQDLKTLADEMVTTMHESHGIGLAAPQVGILRRLIVVDVSDEHDEPVIMVNPRVTRRNGEHADTEGCLSIPTLQVEVRRARDIEVIFQDVNGREHSMRGKGLWARVVQHEVDHLDGRLIVDYMTAESRAEFESTWPEVLREALRRRAAGLTVGGDEESPEADAAVGSEGEL